MDGAGELLALPIPGLLPVEDAREPLRVLVASLAPGGAERIVLEWLGAEIARGREAELAVLHPRRNALAPPPGLALRTRGRESAEDFLAALANDWRGAAPVSTHLVADDGLAILARHGLRVVPVVHNAREGWRNDPASWDPVHVPLAVACADAVRAQMIDAGCRVPVVPIRHRPRVGRRAFDPEVRREMRAELGIGPETFLVAAVGAHKAQKDHARAVGVLARLARRRDAVLVILGGVLDRTGFAELERVVDAAVAHGVASRLRLPGWVGAIEPYLAASDALLNVSRFEGLSIAAQEALAAGLPVVATDVGGQREIDDAALTLLESGASEDAFAAHLAALPVRSALQRRPVARAPRAWSLTTTWREASGPGCDTLFVTANLNAGGAQRSLVNLCGALGTAHRLAVAVCNDSTHEAFAHRLRVAGIDCFRATLDRDDFAIAESLLAHAARRGARALCFWNVAPGVKLLVARFAPAALKLVDVSPGGYAFEELRGAGDLADAIAFDAAAFHARLDALVVKHGATGLPACKRVEVIPNGVAARGPARRSAEARFLVSGRLAPSKRLETIVEAFRLVAAREPAAELHIVGPVEQRHAQYAHALRERARGLAVHMRGADFDLACLAEPWTAAVVLGTHQGSPNAVLEAMAASIPVIANDSGGTRELVEAGCTGWLLPEDVDAAGLAHAMAEAAANRELASERAQRALERVRAHHGLARMAQRYRALLESLASREKMAPWTSASAPAAPNPSSSVPSPTMATP